MDDEGVGIVSTSVLKKSGVVQRKGARPEHRRPIVHQIGAVSTVHILPVSDPDDPKSQEVGVKERILRQPPVPLPDVCKEFALFVSKWLTKHLRDIPELHPTFEDWIENAPYNQNRKKQLKLQRERGEERRSWDSCSSFIKREFYTEFKDPRTINSRVDNYKVFAGPWISAIEHDFCPREPSFVKGMTPQERAQRAFERVHLGSVMFNTDFSRYESQMTKFVIKEIECQLYRRYGMPEYLLKPLYGINKCSLSGVRYRVSATRMSGDMNTSLGNGFVNLMVNKFVAHRVGSKIKGVVEGDDGLFACYGPMPSAQDYADVGFKITICPMSKIDEGDFCSAKIYELADGSVWTLQDPRRVLLKAGWSFVCPPEATFGMRRQLMNAKSLSIADNNPQCPLLWKYCQKYTGECVYSDNYSRERFGGGNSFWVHTKSDSSIVKEPTLEMRQIFLEVYGLSVAQQLEMEDYISTHDDLDHPELALFLGGYSQSSFMYASTYMD